MFKYRLQRGEGVLHHCIEGEKVGVDGSKIVDVDRRPDRCPSGTPVPPEVRGREPPSFFFFHGLPPRWEESYPSGPSRSSEIGFPSLFPSVSRSPNLAENRFLYFGRSVTPITLR